MTADPSGERDETMTSEQVEKVVRCPTTTVAEPTPGEWFVEAGPLTNVVVWSRVSGDRDDDKHIVTVASMGPIAKRIADANLIAAAKNMLALLKRYRNETPLAHQPHMIAHDADAVIAKATGASNA